MQKRSLNAVTLALALALSGCGMLPDKIDETKNWSANKLYAEARDELSIGNYEKAIEYFEKLQSRYPFGTYAQQAQMEVAYAHYKQGEQPEALATVERFPKATRDAFEAFKLLAERFPDSPYTADALARMKYLVNAMAQYEVHVANYYYRRGAYLAAANRAQAAVTNYQDAPAIEEALRILVRSYDALNLPKLRDDAQRILDTTFPNRNNAVLVGEKSPWWKFW